MGVAVETGVEASANHFIDSAVGGTVIVGAVVSLTRKSLVAVAVLPQLSVAVKVPVTVRLQLSGGGVWLCVRVADPPQLSVALAVAVHALTVAALKHSIDSAVGGTVIVGAVVSLTRKSLVAVAVLPQLSDRKSTRLTPVTDVSRMPSSA